MRTKALLLTAAVAAAGIVSPMAQVFSVNAVGYVSKTIPPGFSMIANPLDAEDNTIAGLFPDAPLFSNFYKWNGTGFDIATRTGGGWNLPDLTLNPGEGGFINPGTEAYDVVFVGEVPQGDLSTAIPQGFSIVASQVPQGGTVGELGLTESLNLFDNLYQYSNTENRYTIYTLSGGGWNPSEPSIELAESVFVNAGVATSWDRSFSVNQ